MADQDDELVTLVDDEGHEHQFSVVDIIEVEDRRYALMIPAGEAPSEEEEEEAYIFRLETADNGEEVLVDIDDDAEFERVCAAFDNLDEEEDEEE